MKYVSKERKKKGKSDELEGQRVRERWRKRSRKDLIKYELTK